MIRIAGIVAVTLGLIMQPLMAAIPVEIASQNADTTVDLAVGMSAHGGEHGHHDTQNNNKLSGAPCHEISAENGPSPGTCGHCDTNCANSGICASSCFGGGAAVSGEVMAAPQQRITPAIVGNTERLDSGFLSLIYHPPKHS